jgi:hypothetical protein
MKKLRKLTDAQCKKLMADLAHEIECGCTKRGDYLWDAYQDPTLDWPQLVAIMALAMDGGPDMKPVGATQKQLGQRANQIDRIINETALMYAEPMGHA